MRRNSKAVWAFVTALAALGVLAGGLVAANYSGHVGLYEAIPAVPIGLVLAFVSLRLARRARFEHQRTLGRSGGAGLTTAARILGGIAMVLAVTAALALGVFAALTLASQ
ncbi:MAG TPA: hypothetical protein VH281_07230 [Gaiellaceae bacterium]